METIPPQYHNIPHTQPPLVKQNPGPSNQPTVQPDIPTINLNNIIANIVSALKPSAPSDEVIVTEFELSVLCELAGKVFLRQPSLLELNPADSGLTVVGDLHGHLNDLVAVFRKEGGPDVHNYLFLGNYVGTGRHQVELICLLLAYKLKYPENFFLLRGCHENRDVNNADGFWHRCRELYGTDAAWAKFNLCFDTMPLAAVLGDRIFCVHSGISPHLEAMVQLRNIQRPMSVPPNGLVFDLLTAMPTVATPGWNTNQQSTAMAFGNGVWKKFFRSNDIEFMIRSHGTLGTGFALTEDKRILSIFSATDYEARDNNGSFVHISPTLTVQPYTFNSHAIFKQERIETKE
ncbi:serine/threonine-protein phosphatase alpha-3 isoform-like [Paramacrobiotus metropolitanus]|uniref:serine/threonine-protein phosphatase alpha-3 isoform-like n=1 Tax=Paramacrobiotus metropolitanus TaxID=2943436 RepID=UPI0024462D24|nr:serine/threonine-protein phosphatase alpha-3 isoform-like [Paramacrobiotus metropolitanus]